MDDSGQWQLAPFYDVTFSPNTHNQHMMSYGGYGQQPPLKTMQKLAAQANFSSWKEAQKEIEKILESLSQWSNIAKELGIANNNIKLISKQLDVLYREGKANGLY